MDVYVDAATVDDVDAVTDLWVELVESQREYGAHLLGERNRQSARSVIKQYVIAGGIEIARDADRNDVICGFVMFHVETGMYDQDVRKGIVENIYVTPDSRNDGVGSQLMDHAEESLLDRGVDVVTLSVMAENPMARSFYEERGYRPSRVTMERRVDDEGN